MYHVRRVASRGASIGAGAMRQQLGLDQQRRVEEFLRRKGQRCTLWGSADLRCGNSAARYSGGGYNVRLICTDAGDQAHIGGIGLIWDHSITADEAQGIGLH